MSQCCDIRQRRSNCQTCNTPRRQIPNQIPRQIPRQSGGGCAVPPMDVVSAKYQPATYPTLQADGIRLACYDQACPSIQTTANQCFIKTRHYIQPWTERPSYYLDLTQPFIGGRPVRQAHNVNAIPRTMRFDSANLVGRDFHCQQPCWSPKCI